MSTLMRKYKKHILIVTIALIVGPFVIWGGYRGASNRGDEAEDVMAPVAVVEGAAIPAAEFRQALNDEIQQRSRYGQDVEYTTLRDDGTARRVIESLVSRRLLEIEAQETGYTFSKEFLVEQLKKEFKDEQGNFDAEKWNRWVEFIDQSSGQSWNQIYADVANQLRRQLLINEVVASARVSEKELKRQFEDQYTKLDLKFVKVAPAIEPTEEELKAHYEADPSAYDIPAKRKADFVALSLRPPKPALADEIVQKARGGADFAELAKEYSEGVDKEQGGDMGWVTKTPQTPAQQEALFALKPGEVSEPVEGPGGQYFIFKAEEERVSEVTNERDVKARRIVLSPTLSAEERAAQEEKAAAIAAAAKESGELATAAAEAGVEVQTTGLFGPDTVTIESIPQEDTFQFRQGMSQFNVGVVSDVIKGQANLYVAKVVEMTQPEPQPFEAVKDQVREDFLEVTRRSPEYMEKTRTVAEDIKKNVTVLGEVPEKYPELSASVQEIEGYSAQDYSMMQKLPMNPRQVFTMAEDKQPGDVFGPVQDFMGDTYLLQLVAKHPPTDADWEEKWPEEREQLRDRVLAMAQQQRFADYLQYLRDKHSWGIVNETFQRIFEPATEETGEETAEGQSADTTDAEGTAEDTPAEAAPEVNAEPEAAPAEPAAE